MVGHRCSARSSQLRPLRVPIGRPLIHGRGPQQPLFVERAALQSAGRSAGRSCVKPHGNADAADAGEVRRDRVQVFQVHRQRVVGLLAELERRRGRRRADDEIDFLEGLVVVAADQPADLEGLEVVRVVVAGD